MLERVTYPNLPTISGPYVHAVKHHASLYVSGLTAFGTDSQTDELGAQALNILSQIEAILVVENCSKADLIKLTIFVVDISQLGTIRELLFDFYEGYLPACSLVEVSQLIHSDLKIEIECLVAL